MIFKETKIKGAFLIEPELIPDKRGFFARSFCKDEFKKHGLETDIVQCNISYNKKKGTLRGMHYQVPPSEEEKIVSCIKGSIFDVIVDLRKNSPSYLQWHSEKLLADSFRMLYLPKGCAHGFQTLEDNCIVYYQMGESYHPACARGLRWNDPSIGIVWPVTAKIISEKDKNYGNFCI
jgi:dTDP-4-dehydrorhamnose 3,5-epimerase